VLLACLALLAYVPAASAAPGTYVVDNTGDDAGGGACTVGPIDCSLRSAVDQANLDPGATITFDPAVFTGAVGTSTIAENVAANGSISPNQPVTIAGGNCGTTNNPRPCVGIHANGAGPALQTQRGAAAGGISISGIAFTHSTGTAGNGNSAIGDDGDLTVKGSWFGVKLDGTTLGSNDNGIIVLSHGPAVIGGTTPAERNVFADNGTAVVVANTGAGLIRGNYFGTLPDGSPAAVTPTANENNVGILIAAQGAATDGTTIGGDATTAGQCDGACNLIGGFGGDGIRLINVGAPGSSLSGTTIRGNFVGLRLDGAAAFGNATTGIALSDATNTTIGGASATQRNYIASNGGGASGQGGVYGPSASGVTMTNNFIGTTVAGNVARPNLSVTGAGAGTGASLGDSSTFTNNVAGNSVWLLNNTGNSIVKGNSIGVGVGSAPLPIATGEAGLRITWNTSGTATVGGTTAGDGNTIGNVQGGPPALLLNGGVNASTIQGNFIGTTATGTPEANGGNGIQLGENNAVTNNTVGGLNTAGANWISNAAGNAIEQERAGDGNLYLENFGKNNGGPSSIFIDIGANGPGAPSGHNNGIAAPSVNVATHSVSGTARANAVIRVYETYSSHDDARQLIATPTADGSGNWSANLGAFTLEPGQCVTANQTDTANNSSEMATPVTVGGGSCLPPPITTLTSGPAEGSVTSNRTPSFAFSSSENSFPLFGFQCRVDGDPFASCTSPFTTPALNDGPHGFHIQASDRVAPALGTDFGNTIDRSFEVDTTGPVATFLDSGPADGATIDTTSASYGFSATDEHPPNVFQCKVDSGAFAACSSPFTASGLSEGAHTISVRATDSVGNVGAAVSRSVRVKLADKTAPTVAIGKIKVKKKKATASFSATDSGAPSATPAGGISFKCKLDKAAYKACSSPQRFKRLKKGKHTLSVTATDADGNASAPVSKKFRVRG